MTATVIYPAAFATKLHIASAADEFVAVCGTTTSLRHPVMLAEMRDPKKKLLPGYVWCEACVAARKR
jgi:hypothetical protein